MIKFSTYCLLLTLLCIASAYGIADEPAFSAADLMPFTRGVSMLRYFGHGLGAYPYKNASPHSGMKVRIDGVPLRSVSPFGPDLDLIPAACVDSLSTGVFNTLDIVTKWMTDSDSPETMTKFSLGTKHRFNFETLFTHPLSERSGLVFSGVSSGSRGMTAIEKTSYRSYSLNYFRKLSADARLLFSSRGWRDRDGLADLDTASFMGERKSDGTSFMLGIDNVNVGNEGVLASNIYWQSMNSRFTRFGSRKSLDDTNAGVNVRYSNALTWARYTVYATHDIYSIVSRIHDNSWSRNESDLSASMIVPFHSSEIKLNGGFLHSSKYGAGVKGSFELVTGFDRPFQLVLSAGSADFFPETGSEFYTSLSFSDSTHVADLEKSNERIVKLGVRDSHGQLQFGLSAFVSKSESPVFRISSSRLTGIRVYSARPTESVMAEREFKGVEGDIAFAKEGAVDIDLILNGCLRSGGDYDSWPYPDKELHAGCVLSDSFFGDELDADIFFDATFNSWEDGWALPESGHVFLDTGLSLSVGTLALFYRIENMLNEDPGFFGTMGWFGRNAMWGAAWRFID